MRLKHTFKGILFGLIGVTMIALGGAVGICFMSPKLIEAQKRTIHTQEKANQCAGLLFEAFLKQQELLQANSNILSHCAEKGL